MQSQGLHDSDTGTSGKPERHGKADQLRKHHPDEWSVLLVFVFLAAMAIAPNLFSMQSHLAAVGSPARRARRR
jgi:hypothetical protein